MQRANNSQQWANLITNYDPLRGFGHLKNNACHHCASPQGSKMLCNKHLGSSREAKTLVQALQLSIKESKEAYCILDRWTERANEKVN